MEDLELQHTICLKRYSTQNDIARLIIDWLFHDVIETQYKNKFLTS